MPDYSRRSGHPQLRALLLSRYIPGITLCWRCEKPITTLRTRDIHLGHDDNNPLVWRGLEHAACSLRSGGIIRSQMAKPLPRRVRNRRHSRQW